MFTSRLYSVLILAALVCTLAAKLFHSVRSSQAGQYIGWVLADIAVLLGIEISLALICYMRPRKWVFRLATAAAAIVCTWSFINAGWLIRTGKQIVPTQLFPLIRDPWTTAVIIIVNLIKMPAVAVILIGVLTLTFTFLFFVLVKPKLLKYNRNRLVEKTAISAFIIIFSLGTYTVIAKSESVNPATLEMRYNCQLQAATNLIDYGIETKADSKLPGRHIPFRDEINISLKQNTPGKNYNVVIIVLEGVQYKYTSLYDHKNNLTPYLLNLAREGAEFTHTRSSFTYSTKAIFSLMTGRYPSATFELPETLPQKQPYASIATILEDKLNYRTAYFLSAKGEFECGPGLVHNLGFDKFWARECLPGTDSYIGYLSSDEYAMIKPITEWIASDSKPFVLSVVCSVTHDPYEPPRWYAPAAKEPVGRYQQAITYTDSFISALDSELAKMNLKDNTIFCVLSDHGEAFGEHGQFTHEGMGYEEALRVPFVIRCPGLISGGTKVSAPVSLIDVVPTILNLAGLEVKGAGFDGLNALGLIPEDRKVFFVGGMYDAPLGYVEGKKKFIYEKASGQVYAYDLGSDPLELSQIKIDEPKKVIDEITGWHKAHILELDDNRHGQKLFFGNWLIKWKKNVARARYQKSPELAKQF